MTQNAEKFTVGPPDPILDSRQLPAVTDDDEAAFVTGDDLADDHPDNSTPPPDADIGIGPVDEGEYPPDGEEPVSEDELAALVADEDRDDVDPVGFDESDLETGIEMPDEPVGGGS